MNIDEAIEARAYKDGYEAGKKDAMATAGKPLEEYLHPVDNYAGLKGKYLVFKADSRERIANCFVLRPGKDTAAVEALRAYANATENKTLADDIYNWVGKGVIAQQWTPVSKRLPDEGIPSASYLCYWNGCRQVCKYSRTRKCFTFNGRVMDVTHWMPLPEPPKENI